MKSLFLTAVATFGLTVATLAQVPSYVPTNGLVGWWPFHGNANDESGNGNNGTVNGATLTTDRFGNANKAYSFDGVNDYVEGVFNNFPLGNSARSVSTWILLPQTNNIYTNFITSWGLGTSSQSSANQAFGIITNLPNYIALWQAFGASEQNQSFNNANLNQNLYFHLAVTIDPLGNFIFYINGLQVYNNVILGLNTVPNGNVFRFGRSTHTNTDGWAGYFLGLIDDIGIWNRALTQQEITALYNGCQLAVNTQPTSQTININNNTQFTIGSSDPNASYQWQTDLGVGFQNLTGVGQYSGATTNTLTVSNVTMSNNNQAFRCIVSSGTCSDTSDVAILTVNNNASIESLSQERIITVYPNPTQNQLYVKAGIELLNASYSILDNAGRSVLTGQLTSESTVIELSGLSNGTYFLHVGDQLKESFKVVKNQ